MYCEYCGEKIPNDCEYCPNCGVNVKKSRGYKKSSQSQIIDELSKSFEDWKTWSGKKKFFSLIACCCIGWILISLLCAVLIPDNNVVDDSNVNTSSVSEPANSSGSLNVSSSTSENSSGSAGGSSGSSTSSSSTSSSGSSSSGSSSSSSSGTYIGNSNTGKFHTAYCSYVNRMKSSNKVYFSSRDDAIARGYVPCKVCNP